MQVIIWPSTMSKIPCRRLSYYKRHKNQWPDFFIKQKTKNQKSQTSTRQHLISRFRFSQIDICSLCYFDNRKGKQEVQNQKKSVTKQQLSMRLSVVVPFHRGESQTEENKGLDMEIMLVSNLILCSFFGGLFFLYFSYFSALYGLFCNPHSHPHTCTLAISPSVTNASCDTCLICINSIMSSQWQINVARSRFQ